MAPTRVAAHAFVATLASPKIIEGQVRCRRGRACNQIRDAKAFREKSALLERGERAIGGAQEMKRFPEPVAWSGEMVKHRARVQVGMMPQNRTRKPVPITSGTRAPTASANSRRVGSRRVGSRRVGSRRVGSRRVGSRRVGLRLVVCRGPAEPAIIAPERTL